MSGRKASEVNALLRNGKSTRSGAIDMLNSSYENVQDAVRHYDEFLDSAKSTLSKIDVKMAAAEDEFPDAAKGICDSIEGIKKKISAKKLSTSDRDYKQEYESLMASFRKLDSEAASIAASVRCKSHYCDEEYRRADRVARNYENLRQQVYSMNNKYQTRSASLGSDASEIRRLHSQLTALVDESKTLEKKAKDVKTLRDNASKAKSSAESDFKSIDAKIADKFMAKEYESLKEQLVQFLNKSDAQVMKAVTSLLAEMKNFSLTLNEKYEDFLRKQTVTKTALDAMKNRISRKILKDPFDEFKKEDPRALSLVEFLDEHCQGKFSSDIQSAIYEAESLFKKEKFDKADKVLAELNSIVDEASNLAAQTHEHRKQTIDNVLAIRSAMLDLQYDVSAKIQRDADGNFAGYTITCYDGEDKIVLDNINVGDDGKLGFGIDHTESAKGSCRNIWPKIKNKFVENGVMLQDVLKDGHSVIYDRVVANKTSSTQKNLKGKN